MIHQSYEQDFAGKCLCQDKQKSPVRKLRNVGWCVSALQLGQQIEYLRLVALEGAQADTIQQRTNLFLRAAFLDREPNDVLLARPHAVNG